MRGFAVILSLVLALVVLFGCAPAAPPSPTASPAPRPTVPPPPTAAPSPTAPATPAATVVKTGGILRTWSMVTPPGFDMHRRPSYGPIFGMPIFNNLVQFDPTKVEVSPATVQGDLAEKWDVSADGKAYTFYLRKDVKWHDGTPFTADDVVYSIEKMMDKNRSSLWSDFPAYESVAKVDDYTVRVNLKNPSASFLFQLAGPYASIQAKHKATVDFRSPDFLMGTGPFKYSKYTTGVLMEYVKNPNYFKKDSAGRQLPYLDGLTINIFTDKSAALDGVVTKRLEGHASFSTNNQEEYERVMGQNKDYVTTFYYPPGIALVWVNPNFGPFKDVRVREALRLLLDKDLMVTAGYGDKRWGMPDRTILTGAYGLDANEMKKLIGYDLPTDQRIAKAKKLMADAGYEKGFKLRLVGRVLGEFQRMGAWLGDQYRRHLNVELEIVAREINEARKMRDNLDFELYMDNPLVLTGDPDEYATYFMTTGAGNFTKAGSVEQDRLWAAQSQATDFAKRQEMCREIERLIIKDAYFWNISNNVYTAGWQNYVKGYFQHALIYSNRHRMETVWLDK